MTRNYMTEAFQILNTVQGFVFPDRPGYPSSLYHTHSAPDSRTGRKSKEEIAKDIVENTADGDIVAGLMNLTDYWWKTLLVPRNSLYPLQFLLMKSAD